MKISSFDQLCYQIVTQLGRLSKCRGSFDFDRVCLSQMSCEHFFTNIFYTLLSQFHSQWISQLSLHSICHGSIRPEKGIFDIMLEGHGVSGRGPQLTIDFWGILPPLFPPPLSPGSSHPPWPPDEPLRPPANPWDSKINWKSTWWEGVQSSSSTSTLCPERVERGESWEMDLWQDWASIPTWAVARATASLVWSSSTCCKVN